MKQEYFEIVTLLLKIILIISTCIVVPAINTWLKSNTTQKQRDNALFWLRIAIKAAEDIYKEKGQGAVKKEYVINWLNKNNIKISKEQLDVLIDQIVDEFNKNGWNNILIEDK